MCTNISQKQAQKIREESLKSLKQALKQSKGVEVTHKYYINLPTEEAHHKCPPILYFQYSPLDSYRKIISTGRQEDVISGEIVPYVIPCSPSLQYGSMTSHTSPTGGEPQLLSVPKKCVTFSSIV